MRNPNDLSDIRNQDQYTQSRFSLLMLELTQGKSPEQIARPVLGLIVPAGLWLLLGTAPAYFWLLPSIKALTLDNQAPIRLIIALLLGPFIWLGAVAFAGAESGPTTDIYCIIPTALMGLIWYGIFKFIFGMPTPAEVAGTLGRVRAKTHDRSEGRADHEEIAQALGIPTADGDGGIPLAHTDTPHKYKTGTGKTEQDTRMGVPYKTGQGHVLVCGPTRSGKGLHLTEALLWWPGPAVVIDPKAEQFEIIAGIRSKWSEVYRIGSPAPHDQVSDVINLAEFIDLTDQDQADQLHFDLLKPWAYKGDNAIFATHSRPLFHAIGLHAQAKGGNPIALLLRAAANDPRIVLTKLAEVRPQILHQFGKPDDFDNPRSMAAQSWHNFVNALYPFQKHIDTVTGRPAPGGRIITAHWVQQKATIFFTYDLTTLNAIGPLVTATLSGLTRNLVRTGNRERVLFAYDELTAVAPGDLAKDMATLAGYGVSLALYVQDISQLRAAYRDGWQAIISNAAHQVYYAPNDQTTAEEISRRYGTKIIGEIGAGRPAVTLREGSGGYQYSHRIIPALTAAEVSALDKDQVLVFTQTDRKQYKFVGRRLDMRAGYKNLPLPPMRYIPQPPAPTAPAAEKAPTNAASALAARSPAAGPPTTATPAPAATPEPQPPEQIDERPANHESQPAGRKPKKSSGF